MAEGLFSPTEGRGLELGRQGRPRGLRREEVVLRNQGAGGLDGGAYRDGEEGAHLVFLGKKLEGLGRRRKIGCLGPVRHRLPSYLAVAAHGDQLAIYLASGETGSTGKRGKAGKRGGLFWGKRQAVLNSANSVGLAEKGI